MEAGLISRHLGNNSPWQPPGWRGDGGAGYWEESGAGRKFLERNNESIWVLIKVVNLTGELPVIHGFQGQG